MWPVFALDILLNGFSLFINILLFLATLRDKDISNRAKVLILMFVVCDLTTSITYLFCVTQKISLNQKLIYPETARGLGIINWTLFVHEAAFFMFAMNVFLVAAERLALGKFRDFMRDHNWFCNVITLLAVLFSIGVSFFASHLQHIGKKTGIAKKWISDGIRVPPALSMNFLQFTGIFMLLLTIQINKTNYVQGRGENLELRYQCAQTYYYNVTLFCYLLGSVCCRFIAFNCIVVLIVLNPTAEIFGWLSFCYHNINAISNSIFPWIVILRNKRFHYFKCYASTHPELARVNDLTGKALDTQATGEKYFHLLQKSW